MTRERDGAGRGRYGRRTVLATVAGLAGCVSLGDDGPTDGSTPAATDGAGSAGSTVTRTRTETPTATPDPTDTGAPAPTDTPTPDALAAVTGDYPAYRHAAGRRAYTPATAGPAAVPEAAYTLEFPGAVYQPVVDADRLFLAGPAGGPERPTVAAFDLRRGTRLWNATLDGAAGAAPTVVGDRVVVQTAGGVHALARDGSRAWSSGTVAARGFAPAAVGDSVYAVGERGLAALGVDGTESWSVPLGARPLASAAADGTAVYLLVPRDMTTMGLLALDAEDGTTRWRRAVEARSGFPPARAGDAVYVTSDRRQGGVTALAADSGERLWQAGVRLDRGPAVTESRIVVARGSRVLALSRADGAVDWETDLASEVVTAPVADGVAAYVGLRSDEGGRLAAVDVADGEIRYTLALECPVDRVVILEEGLAVTTRGASGPARLHVFVRS
ncbi:MAG: PQQ-binding-like beta-propeller repeat protein [Haloarculaceae archaeon]